MTAVDSVLDEQTDFVSASIGRVSLLLPLATAASTGQVCRFHWTTVVSALEEQSAAPDSVLDAYTTSTSAG